MAIPHGGPHVGGVTAVDFWRSVPPNPTGTVTLAATETYVTNNGDGIINNVDGVDPNRNFPTHWGYDDEGSSPAFSGRATALWPRRIIAHRRER